MADYPWYERVEGRELLQGDLLNECPFWVHAPDFPTELENVAGDSSGEFETFDAVVLSQSCDLVVDKVDLVLLAPHYPFDEFAERSKKIGKPKDVGNKLRRAEMVAYHLLNEGSADGLSLGFRVVDFRNVFSLPLSYLRRLAEARSPRLRLMPPYREHLSQAFARFIMRVGLPEDIPPFK